MRATHWRKAMNIKYEQENTHHNEQENTQGEIAHANEAAQNVR